MDATAWVALAGIAGTLVGAIGAPVFAERVRRQGVRDERLMTERLAVYGDPRFEYGRADRGYRSAAPPRRSSMPSIAPPSSVGSTCA